MAPNAIVMKLNTLLVDPIDSEYKVVYLLCEVRKLMEPVAPRERPFALNMYCHWALHVALHGKDTITPFMRQIDAYVDSILRGKEDLRTSHQMVRDFALFDTFRAQLREFFLMTGIRTDLTDQDARWSEFVTHFANVIEDGSLSIRADDHGLTHVKEVTFVKGSSAIGEFNQVPFEMVWRVSLLDGRELDIDVNSRARRGDVKPMIGWGVHMKWPRQTSSNVTTIAR